MLCLVVYSTILANGKKEQIVNSIYLASCLIKKSLRFASRSMSSSKLSVMSTKIMTLNENFHIVVVF